MLTSKRDQALFRVAYTYGLASEIGLMHREDVDLARLKIRIQRLKGSISSDYPLRPTVARALRSYLRSRKDPLPSRRKTNRPNGFLRALGLLPEVVWFQRNHGVVCTKIALQQCS